LASPVLRRTALGSRSLSAFLQLATESDQNALTLHSKPVHFGTDPDPDPAISVSDLQDANKMLFYVKFLFLLLFEGIFTSFFKDKKP
jgi:hypothetical protein